MNAQYVPNIGEKVTGTYLGHAFTGTVYDRLFSDLSDRATYLVRLDTPLSVFGDTRGSLAVTPGNPETTLAAA